jgi:hypothetical protein
MKFCKKCLLPETYPKLYLNSDGYCNVCVEYEKKFKNFDPHNTELELKRKLDQDSKNNHTFIVTCSGGIDSSYVLYLCKTKYKLNIIGANFDHGFQSDTAKQNLFNLSKILNIPITTVKPNFEIMYRLYRDFLLRTGDFCTPCCQGCCRSGFIVAEANNTQTIIHGGISGSRVEFNVLGMYKHHYERFMKIIGDDYKHEELKDIVTPTDEIKRFNLISLPQYANWDIRKIVRILKKELNWKAMPNGRTWRVDCLIADAADHFLQRKFGFSRHWMSISANLRAGIIDIEEARSLFKNHEEAIREEPKEAIDILLEKTALTKKQINELPFFNSEPAIKFLK